MLRTIAKVIFLLIVTAWPLKAEILGVASLETAYRMRQLEPHYGGVFLDVSDFWIVGIIQGVSLFGDVVLDSSCVDTTFTATASMGGSDFAEAAWRLTDGNVTYIGIGFIPTHTPKLVLLCPVQSVFSLETVDFTNATIESISLRVDELSFDDSSGVTRVTIAGTITIEGSGYFTPVEQCTWGHLKILYMND